MLVTSPQHSHELRYNVDRQHRARRPYERACEAASDGTDEGPATLTLLHRSLRPLLSLRSSVFQLCTITSPLSLRSGRSSRKCLPSGAMSYDA